MIGLCGMVSLGRTETVYMYCVSRAYPSRATKIVLRSAHKRAQKPACGCILCDCVPCPRMPLCRGRRDQISNRVDSF